MYTWVTKGDSSCRRLTFGRSNVVVDLLGVRIQVSADSPELFEQVVRCLPPGSTAAPVKAVDRTYRFSRFPGAHHDVYQAEADEAVLAQSHDLDRLCESFR